MSPVDQGNDPPTLALPVSGRAHEADDGNTQQDIGGPPAVAELPSSVSGAIIADDATSASGIYAFGDVIGRGGMGEVLLAHDRKIGRDVAVKRLRASAPSPDDIARFLREARIQARLDHPAIVPVYEVGRNAAGHPYFTMKRLTGATLVDRFAKNTPRLRLLRAFVDICRAVEFAHARGVIHRDLKPANIVLGDYGEVYLLDWGVALVVSDESAVGAVDADTLEGSSPPGKVLGTPGYMAPEQLTDPEVGRPADVYSLGSILFELLAGERLHPKGNPAIQSTLGGTTVTSPALRRPERNVPPELDGLCVAMLAITPEHRPTAHRCADCIEEYLDGDRDLVRRRSLAVDLAWKARAALDAGQRADAMRDASRALALDPEANGAAEIVTTLMLEPPRERPPELAALIEQADHADISRHAKAAIPGYILMAAFLPIIIWNGVLSWIVVLSGTATAIGMAIAARQLMRHPGRSLIWMVVYAIGNAVALAMVGRLAGPLTFVPALVAFITASVVTYPAFVTRPWLLLAIMLVGFLAPFGLETLHVLASSWELRENGLLLHGSAMKISGSGSVLTIVIAGVATVVMAGVQSSVLGRANRDAQHRLVTQAWHLAQLLPAAAAAPARGSRPPPSQVAG